MNTRLFALPCLLALLGASCAPQPAEIATTAATPPASAVQPTQADASSGSEQTSPVQLVDRTCKIDADCAIKDVGSCCGAHPSCVNKNSPTFPKQVKAQCGNEHRMGICSIPALSGCSCVQGQCSDINAADAAKTH